MKPMTNFTRSMDLLFKLEFSSPKNFLHKNKTEKDYTIGGIYKYAHPNWIGWEAVRDAIQNNGGNLIDASISLYYNESFKAQVYLFYKKEFWDRMKLDEIDAQIICNEIFLFGVNAGTRNAVRKAQKIIEVKADGLVGPHTIENLNCYDPQFFSMEFDKLELQYYADIISSKPSMSIFRVGWTKRAYAV